MRRTPLILASLIFILYGMSEPARISPELKNLKVRVTDVKGVVHELKGFSCNDKGVLRLKRGSLDYTIPLSSVKRLKVINLKEGSARVEILMEDGSKEVFEISSSTRCRADSDVGSVSFYIGKVREIEFLRER